MASDSDLEKKYREWLERKPKGDRARLRWRLHWYEEMEQLLARSFPDSD